jgi:hypothetical protein
VGPGSDQWHLDPTELKVSQNIWIPPFQKEWLDGSEEQMHRLESERWLNPHTTRVKVSFVLYSGTTDVLTLTNIHFIFPRTGHIFKRITHRSFLVEPYLLTQNYVFETLFFGQITFMFLVELLDVSSYMRKYKCSPIPAIREYMGFWNLVDWVCIGLSYSVLVLWVASVMAREELKNELLGLGTSQDVFTNPAVKNQYDNWFENIELFGQNERRNRSLSSILPLIILLRLFKAFSAQPRLALVTNTLVTASVDLFHFGIVLLSVFLTYSLMGVLFFGHEDLDFATLDRSMMTCFCMLMGDFDTEEMEEVGRLYPAFVYFVSFMVLMVLIVLNMLIAILMDAYAEVKAGALHSETLFGQIWELLLRTYRQKRGVRLPMGVVLKAFLAKSPDAAESDAIVTVQSMMQAVPKLTETQAHRDLCGAAEDWAGENNHPVQLHEILCLVSKIQSSCTTTASGIAKLRADFNANLLKLPVPGRDV